MHWTTGLTSKNGDRPINHEPGPATQTSHHITFAEPIKVLKVLIQTTTYSTTPSHQPMAPRVLLLRTPATPPETDRYEAALTRASFRPLSLPLLGTEFENLERLSCIVRGEAEDGKVDGVIVTSARAVDACANAGADID